MTPTTFLDGVEGNGVGSSSNHGQSRTNLLQMWLGGLMPAMSEADPVFLRAMIKSAADLGLSAAMVQEEYDRLRRVIQERSGRKIPTFEDLSS